MPIDNFSVHHDEANVPFNPCNHYNILPDTSETNINDPVVFAIPLGHVRGG